MILVEAKGVSAFSAEDGSAYTLTCSASDATNATMATLQPRIRFGASGFRGLGGLGA